MPDVPPPTRVLARAWAGGDRDAGGARGGAARVELALRALPLPGLPRAQGRDGVLAPVGAVLGGRAAPVPPDDAGGGAPARPRAGRDREDRARRVLPDLLGPDAVRASARDPGAGAGERGGFDRGVRARDHARGPDPPRAAVRAVHQRGPDGVPGRRHRLLSERREEVIQYVYERYGTEHTGMVCNLVTYRARSAVREVGYALGFPRPLVDRVAKALETYDSVMVRRDLEAEGGFARVLRAAAGGVAAADAGGAVARGRGVAAAGRRARPDRRDGPAQPSTRRPVRGGQPRRSRSCRGLSATRLVCRARGRPARLVYASGPSAIAGSRADPARIPPPGVDAAGSGPVGSGDAVQYSHAQAYPDGVEHALEPGTWPRSATSRRAGSAGSVATRRTDGSGP